MPFRTPSKTPLQSKGTIKDVPFGELLFRAARERKSATLVLRGGNVEKAFIFQNGLVVGSRSNLPGESLAKLTVVRAKATREVVEGLGVPLLDDNQVAAALAQKAGLAKADLDEVRRYQLLLRLSDTFARPDLAFEWQIAEGVASPIAVNAYQIFAEGVARRLGRDQLESETAALTQEKPRVGTSSVFPIDAATLPPRAAQLFKRIDGRHSFAELVEGAVRTAPPEQAADTAYRTWVYLLAFLEGGFIEIGDAAAAADADDDTESNGRVMVVTSAGGSAVAYTEVEDPAITARYEAMKEQTYFEVLGVAENANDPTVKKAYFKLAKEFHPDKLYNHTDRTVKKYADKAFAIVNKAYEQLKNDEGRKLYMQKLKEKAEGLDLDKEAETLLKAEVEFQKGLVFLRKRDFANAAAQFNQTIELNPRESDHYAYAGWCDFQLHYPANEAGWKAGIVKVDKAIEMNAKSHDALFFLGNIRKLLGEMDKAEQLFQRVLKLRPHHVEAQRELRLIEQRRAKEPADSMGKQLVDKLRKK